MAKFVLETIRNSEGVLTGNSNFNSVVAAALLPQVSVNSNGLRFFGSGQVSFLYQGQGITLGGGSGDLLDVTGGKITGLVGRIAGNVAVTVTGWNFSAKDFYDFVQAPSEIAALSLFFNGSDQVIGSSLGDTIMGLDGNDTLLGGNGIDEIQGGNGRDRIVLGTGNDAGIGDAGKDTLLGGAGNDTLYGSAGTDVLTGGAGADDFKFEEASAVTAGNKITDFQVGIDDIALRGAAFGGLAAGVLSKSNFRVGTAALDASDFIIYDQTTGSLYYDADGNGAGLKIKFAAVTPGTNLTNGDFLIVV